MQPAEPGHSNIYDLGYRGYDGPRLGRRYAFMTLYIEGVKGAFGIGRGAKSKILPMALGALAFLPAVVQLGAAAVGARDFDIVRASEYYEWIQVILVLFVAASAPELTGRDQRNRTLSLYFSRPLTRDDYAFAKLAAMTTALLFLTVAPQSLMFAGNALTTEEWREYLRDNGDQVAPILAGGLVTSAVLGTIGVAVASQTHRRMFAAGSILALQFVSLIVGSTIINAIDGDIRRLGVLIPPIGTLQGFVYWVFGDDPPAGGDVASADLPGVVYATAVVAWIAVSLVVTVRRYRGIAT